MYTNRKGVGGDRNVMPVFAPTYKEDMGQAFWVYVIQYVFGLMVIAGIVLGLALACGFIKF